MSAAAEALLSGGAVVALVAVLLGLVRWLVKRLDACEERERQLEERLVGKGKDEG